MIVLTDEDMADLPLAIDAEHRGHALHARGAAGPDPAQPQLLRRAGDTGVRAYALLRDALERSGKMAMAQVALRQRESLATLRTRDGLLVLETLLWPDEIRAADFAFLDDDVQVRSQELKMAAR